MLLDGLPALHQCCLCAHHNDDDGALAHRGAFHRSKLLAALAQEELLLAPHGIVKVAFEGGLGHKVLGCLGHCAGCHQCWQWSQRGQRRQFRRRRELLHPIGDLLLLRGAVEAAGQRGHRWQRRGRQRLGADRRRLDRWRRERPEGPRSCRRMILEAKEPVHPGHLQHRGAQTRTRGRTVLQCPRPPAKRELGSAAVLWIQHPTAYK
mmetsp:Transcript_100557/g.280062  ORF Transcript_100557/g.280062 Transcript_100557/m.280062 type:complete len:207 (-) Transcript_100557:141-761(-)